ncbi:hypothetical protein Mapa_002810 [Marchantia paleacea]|nr:hypothetical protein Mapa_002810 [Marchantia paleacea]
MIDVVWIAPCSVLNIASDILCVQEAKNIVRQCGLAQATSSCLYPCGTFSAPYEGSGFKFSQGDESIVWENPETPANVDDYVFVNGKRMVRPYFFEFICHVKKRWAGKTIVDLFSGEFRQRPREYYIQAVERGRLRVGGMRVPPSYVVRDADKISHFVHRHEPPVLAEPVTVLEKTADVITVYKPASVPVHPCGQYRKNTVVGILEAEHKTGQLFPIHRLDRLVSGLLILARNAKTADKFRQEIEGGRVHKQYVAKVKGVFPAHEVVLNAAVTYDAREGVSTCSVETTTEKDKGKEACTKFQRLSTDGVYSMVRCEPVTGRTHQIRVHLQHLGHPIANDDLYLQVYPPKRTLEETTADTAARKARSVLNDLSKDNHSGVNITACRKILMTEDTQMSLYSEMSSGHASKKSDRQLEIQGVGKGTSLVASCPTDLVSDCHSVEHTSTPDGLAESNCEEDGKIKTTESHPQAVLEGDSPKSSSQRFVLDRLCTHCPNLGPSGYKQDDEGLWLHCVRYACAAWTYECPLPSWAV